MRPLYIETDEEENWLKSFQKASFGGDRSAAGRYAAEQRWKGHVKKEPAGGPPSGGAGDFMRLINGTPQNYEVRGVLQVHSFGVEGDQHYDDLLNFDPTDESSSSAVWHTTVGEFRRMATSGQLDLSPNWVDHVVRNLQDHSDDTRVAVEIGVDSVVFRKEPVTPVRPDEPHTPQDIRTLGAAWHSSARLEENTGLANQTERVLSVNTSPKNKGPVKSGTLGRWEKAWETDYHNLPYCKEIASHAAYLMGQVDAPVERWGRREGFKAPSEAMLAQDAKDLLASVNQGVEGQPVLWRGLDTRQSAAKKAVGDAKVGDTMTLGLASTSRDLLAAAKYAPSYSEGVPLVMMRIEEGSKGVSIGDRALYRHDQEVITSGKFEVTEIQEVTVPKWQFPKASLGGGVETIAPSKRVALERDAAQRLKGLLAPEQYATIERYLRGQEKEAAKYEKETITVKIVSVRQTETFNPETEEFEANG